MSPPAHWRDLQAFPQRLETHFDGRVVSCFSERPRSVWEMFLAAAASHPNQDALVGDQGSCTYSELEQRAKQIATSLTSKGLEKGDRVGVLLGNGFEFVEIYLACAYAGLVMVVVRVLDYDDIELLLLL